MAEIDLATIEQISVILNTIGTLVLVILFWKTIKHLEEASRVSKIQSNYRFRPWIGPSNGIETMSANDKQHQFAIGIKNYGEIPATNVSVTYKIQNEIMNQDIVRSLDAKNNFNLGPLLPNMEKHYWFFVDSDAMQKAKDGSTQIFTLLYFSYDNLAGKSGYGMISQFDPKMNCFVHKSMWID